MRDQLTARGLRRHGVIAHAPGNPMMDGFKPVDCPATLKKFRRLLLLCGSRMPEAFQNFKSLMKALNMLQNREPLAVLVAIGFEPSRDLLESHLKELGYQCLPSSSDIGAQSCWSNGHLLVFLGQGCFNAWSSLAEVGLSNAGTATEQLVGLGIPCVSLPGKGPQFKHGFALRQSRLLGGGVLPSKTPERLVEKLELLLRDTDLRQKISKFGQKRMGSKGGDFALAALISKLMLKTK
tara:strand:- start:269 stop:979 length:711 start_codon:yes stop_codon:yes gene_type:complete